MKLRRPATEVDYFDVLRLARALTLDGLGAGTQLIDELAASANVAPQELREHGRRWALEARHERSRSAPAPVLAARAHVVATLLGAT